MDREPVIAYVGLGANLGDPLTGLRRAVALLGELPDSSLERRSSLYQSAPLDADGPDYINAVVALRTRLSAPDLWHALRGIEQQFGRQRPYRNSPRTLDLDLLLYGSARIESELLTVPHPRMRLRAFVLVPLAEIAGDQVTQEQLRAVADQRLAKLP